MRMFLLLRPSSWYLPSLWYVLFSSPPNMMAHVNTGVFRYFDHAWNHGIRARRSREDLLKRLYFETVVNPFGSALRKRFLPLRSLCFCILKLLR